MSWGTIPDYAGYILWRGSYNESRVSNRAALDRIDEVGGWLTVVFDGGHAIIYTIPSFDGKTEVGHRMVNWGIYTPQRSPTLSTLQSRRLCRLDTSLPSRTLFSSSTSDVCRQTLNILLDSVCLTS